MTLVSHAALRSHACYRLSIQQRFEESVARLPGAVAIEDGGRCMTYAELRVASVALAATLRAHGIGAGDVVAVCVPRSSRFVVSVLAILRCGAAYAPLPLDYPLARLGAMVDDARIPLIISAASTAGVVASLRGDRPRLATVSVDDLPTHDGSVAGRDDTDSNAVDGERPAYVMFTSGSTGRAKGVVVPNRAVVGLVTGQSYADFGPGLRTLLLAPTAFDASTFELWGPLLNGGTVVVAPEGRLEPASLGPIIAAGRVNCLWLTAGLFNEIVDRCPGILAGVAHVLTGGDVLSIAHVRRALETLPGIRITNGYGPTETTTFACTHAIGPNDSFPHGSIPIGTPLEHTTCLVMDENGTPVRQGGEGELWVGGSGVALGYLSGPDGRFVQDPERGGENALMYRTGDLVRRLDDGTFLFLGRMDRQVKISGHRVEPGEVEAVAAAHPLVAAVAVVPFTSADGTALAAFVVRVDRSERPIEGIRAWFGDRLPPALVPARIVSVPEFPLTPNGKLDRDRLLERLPKAAGAGPPPRPPAPACRVDPPVGARREELLRYWRAELAGAPAAIRLPGASGVDREGTNGATLRRSLPGLAGGLRRIARENRCTIAQWLVGVFHAWLHRVTLAKDVVVVTPLSLRAMGVPEDAFGCFLTTVPVRVRWRYEEDVMQPAEGITLPELALRVRRTMIEAGDHADLAFDEIVAAAGRRGRQGVTLADLLVVVTEGGTKGGRFGTAALEPLDCDTATAKFGATFFIDVSGDDVHLAVEYATAVYDGAVVSAHLSTLGELLGGAIADPGATVESLPLAGPGTRRGAASDRRTAGEARPPIHASALGFARIAPHLPAVIAGPTTLSFAQLDDWSRALAARLKELGVGAEDRVGICLPRGAWLCAALLGVLRAGAVCVPLDPSLPAGRLRRMVDIAGVRYALCVERTTGVVASLEGTVAVPVDSLPPAPHFVDPDVGGERLAYVLFTSGSTGDPKGVEMPHGPLAALFEWQARSTPRDPGGRTLHFASVGFDVAFQELFSTWQAGCAVVVAGDDVRRDPSQLVELVSRERVDRMMLPTAMLVPFAEAALASGAVPALVRDVIVAGERLHVTDTVRRLFEAMSGCRLWNHYGPTETHVVTAHLLEGPPAAWPDHPPIGRPIDGAEVTVVGPGGDALPPGCVGEIVLGGGCLARGYASRPDLTAERFRFDGGTVPPSRTYRTGDLGWIRPDGTIECLGRKDRQVKISGHRVEPGEIEAVAAAHPLVEAAAVAPFASIDGAALAAFVVLRDGGEPPLESFREWLRDRLPPALVPARIVSVPGIPLTPNGKVDRDRLVAQLPSRAADGPSALPGTEESLAAAWYRLFQVEPSREADFFECGGNSLAAMRLVAEIERILGVRLPVTAVFQSPRLRDLAAAIDDAVGSRRRPTPTHATGAGVAVPAADGDIPALPVQRGMWLLDELLPDRAAYNQPFAFRPRGPIDWGVVRAGLARAMDAHPALRACLVGSGGDVVQRSSPPGTLMLPWNEDPSVGPEQIASVLAERARVPFDLARAPLWRIDLFPAAAPHGVLLLVFHHAIIDDWSVRLLLDDASAARAGGIVPMSPGSEIDPPDVAERRLWWSERLRGTPSAVVWPGAPVEAREPSGRGDVFQFEVPGRVVDGWRSIARGARSTLFPALLGAFHLWLERVGGCDDTVVLTPVADRSAAEQQASIGCRLDMVPSRMVRCAGNGGRTAVDVTAAVRASFVETLAKLLPFDDIVAAVPGASGSRLQPLSNVMFVLVEEGALARTITGVPVDEVDVHTGMSRFDLTMTLSAGPGGGLRGRVEYSHDVLDRATVGRLVDRFVALLRAVAEDPSCDVDALDLLSDDERARVGGLWDGADVAPEPPMTVHGLLAGVAAARADAVAIVEGGRRFTYRDLDFLARGVERRLRDVGIGAGARVGVTVPRSAEYVAVVLGVLRSGAAWVPIDVGAATSRAEFIAADACLAAVVARGGVTVRVPEGVPVIDVANVPADTDVGASVGCGASPEDPDAVAYVMYTSGSTGKPKGVGVPHRAVVSFLRAMQRRHPLDADDAFLFSTGTTFDISLYEIFGPLAAGARIVVSPPGRPDPGEIAFLMGTEEVSIAQFVPAFLDVLVSDGGLRHASRLRRVFCGGEAMPAALPSRFRAASGAELINVYGPTEATIWATSWSCEEGDGDVGIPIGRPLDNVRARILDAAGRLLPVGVPGELFLGGPQLAVGYHGRAALTAERFVADPRGDVGERLYRTGDVCRWREDGAIEYLGRLDDQVKIRGHRVELGEIEACVAEHSLVERAAACLKRGGDGEVEVVGFVIGDAAIGDGSAVVAHAAGRLPSVMVPARVVRVGGFPVNANGKLDRTALLESDPGPTSRPSPGPAVPAGGRPLSGLEMTILAAWQRSFSRHDVGLDENFFDLGGNSLRAIKLVADVSSALGQRVPVATVFRAPTVRGMAGLLGSGAWQPRFRSLVPLQPLGEGPALFFVHGVTGGVSTHIDVARHLAPTVPVHGLQAVDLDGQMAPHRSVAEMVAHYAAEIRAFQPEGPYYLGGFCLGAYLAYETARRLHEEGAEVGTVFVEDALPGGRLPLGARAKYLAAWIPEAVVRHAGRLSRMAPWQWGRYVYQRTPYGRANAAPADDEDRFNPATNPYFLLARGHRCGPLDADLVLVLSDQMADSAVAVWSALVSGRVEVRRVRAPHEGFTVAGAPAIAEVIRTTFERRRRTSSVSEPR